MISTEHPQSRNYVQFHDFTFTRVDSSYDISVRFQKECNKKVKRPYLGIALSQRSGRDDTPFDARRYRLFICL